MSIKLSTPVLAVAAFALAAVGGGSSFALWNAAEQIDPVIITAGDLEIEASDGVWHEVSPDVAHPQQDIDPATFLVRQGDSLAASFDLTAAVQGDNLVGELGVDWPVAPQLPEGVDGTYALYLQAADGTLTDLTDLTGLGTPVQIDADEHRLVADNAGKSSKLLLTVQLDFSEMEDRQGAATLAQVANLGPIEVTLDQRRTGDGFQ
ncbi:SipW-dependent-type signal peptide-containing protein [Leucobacter sp. HY1908]